MSPDDPVCLCFHVSRRKVLNFIRVERPRRASQLSNCFGAGTGCGWCRPYLERMLKESLEKQVATENSESSTSNPAETADFWNDLTPEEYVSGRSRYVRDGGGTPPPGATPIEPENPDLP